MFSVNSCPKINKLSLCIHYSKHIEPLSLWSLTKYKVHRNNYFFSRPNEFVECIRRVLTIDADRNIAYFDTI